MQFNRHDDLSGRHAFLSPSTNSWLNYDDQKLHARLHTVVAARRGTNLHDLAHKSINLGIQLSKKHRALSRYVTDALSYKMICEQPLFYSENCFGTADTISFQRGKLRIHDLKTGLNKTSMRQLEIYAALFCLEYSIDPFSIEIELRIYQRDDVLVDKPVPELISEIMDKIVYMDNKIQMIKEDL